MVVANVTTASQLFHLLRRQALQLPVKPLVLLTPKRYLRGREAYSPVKDLTGGSFHEVLDDPSVDPAKVRRIIMASGKLGLDLLSTRADQGAADVAVVRVEQLYPWPKAEIRATLERYPAAKDIVWAQEEPANMGAWTFVSGRVPELAAGRSVTCVARPPSGSPATGSHALHELEQRDVLARALGA